MNVAEGVAKEAAQEVPLIPFSFFGQLGRCEQILHDFLHLFAKATANAASKAKEEAEEEVMRLIRVLFSWEMTLSKS